MVYTNVPDAFFYSFPFSFNHILPNEGPFAPCVTTHYFSKIRLDFLAPIREVAAFML